jgi:hypothetical protein
LEADGRSRRDVEERESQPFRRVHPLLFGYTNINNYPQQHAAARRKVKNNNKALAMSLTEFEPAAVLTNLAVVVLLTFNARRLGYYKYRVYL